MADGRIAEACAQLEASERLDPAGGTLLNLATCHEKLGRLATAWTEFKDARFAALRDVRDDRVQLADEHIQSIEARLPRLRVVVTRESAPIELEVRCDGARLPREAWGTPVPVDPGRHVIEASAQGRKVWHLEVQVDAIAAVQSVSVGELEPLAASPADPGSAVSNAHPRAEDSIAGPRVSASSTVSARKIAGGLIVGGGLVAMAVASVFGVMAIDERKASDRSCPDNACTGHGVALNDTAKFDADVSTAGFVIGAAGVVVGATLWLWGGAPSKPPRATKAVTWTADAGPRAGFVRATVSF